MAGTVTAGLKLISYSDTRGIRNFTDEIRNLRIDMLGFEQVASVLQTFGAALRDVGTTGAKAIFGLGQSASELEDIMTQMSAVSSNLTVDIATLRDGFLEISSDLPLSAQELGKVGIEAARAGVSTKDAIDAIALASGKLAALGEDLTEQMASKSLITISNNYGTAANDMAANTVMLADQLAALDSAGIGTARQIAEVAKRASGAGRNFRLSQQDLLALSTAAINTGSSVEVAGSALSNLLNQVAKNTDKAAAATGISSKRLKDLINNGSSLQALREIIQGLAHNSDGTKRSVTDIAKAMGVAGISGVRLGNVVANLANNTDKLGEAIDISANATGALERKYAIFSQSLTQKTKTLVGSIDNLKASFGLLLIPIEKLVIDILNPLVAMLTQMPQSVKALILVFASLSVVAIGFSGALLGVVGATGLFLASAVFIGKTVLSAKRSWKDFTSQLVRTKIAMNKVAKAQMRLNLLRSGRGGSPYARARGITDTEDELSKWGRILGRQQRGSFAPIVSGIIDFEKANKSTVEGLKTFGATFKANVFGPFADFKKLGPVGVFTAINKSVAGVGTSIASALAPLLGGLGASGGLASIGATLSTAAAAAGGLLLVLGEIVAVVLAIVALKPEITGVFKALSNLTTPITDNITKLSKALGIADSNVSAFDATIAMFRFALRPVIVMLELVTGVINSIQVAMKVFGDVTMGLLMPIANVVKRLVDGFSVIGDTIAYVGRELFGLDGSLDFFGTMLAIGETFLTTFLKPWAWTLEIIGDLIAYVFGSLIGGVAEGVMRAFGDATSGVYELWIEIQGLFEQFKIIFLPVLNAFDELAAAMGLSSEGFDLIGIGIQMIAASVRILLTPFTLLVRMLVMVAKFFVMIGRWLVDFFIEPLNGVAGAFAEVVGWVKSLVEWLGNLGGLSNSLKAFFEGIGNFFATGDSSNAGPAESAAPAAVPLSTGGFTPNGVLAQLHPKEAVIPLKQFPEIAAASMRRAAPTFVQAPPASDRGGSGGGAVGGDVSLAITIPVQVMLDDVELGKAVVRLSEDQVRREFGSRNIRLSGIG